MFTDGWDTDKRRLQIVLLVAIVCIVLVLVFA